MSGGGIRLVVFDVDGTLIDSQHHILSAMAAAFESVGQPAPDRHSTLGIVGLSLPVAIRQLAPDAPDVLVDEIVGHYRTAFAALRETSTSPLYPGAVEVIERLAARPEVQLGIATGKSCRGLKHVLELHDLGSYFSTRQVADFHPSKPHPAMLETALLDTGAKARHSVMVGDTTYDMAMARNAGFVGIGVGWGYHPVCALRESGADRVIQDFSELLPTLESLWDSP